MRWSRDGDCARAAPLPTSPRSTRARFGLHRAGAARARAATRCSRASRRTSWRTFRWACSFRAGLTRRRSCRPPPTPVPRGSTRIRSASTIVRPNTSTRGLVASAFGATHHELVLDASRIVGDLPRHSRAAGSADTRCGELVLRVGRGGGHRHQNGAVRCRRRRAVRRLPVVPRLPAAMRWKRRLAPLAPVDGARGFSCAAGPPDPPMAALHGRQRGNGRRLPDPAWLYMPAEVERMAGPALRDCWAAAAARLSAAESELFHGSASSLEGHVARLETRVYLGSQLLRDLDVDVDGARPRGARAVRRSRAARRRLARSRRAPVADAQQTTAARNAGAAASAARRLIGRNRGSRFRSRGGCAATSQPFVRSGMALLAGRGWIARGAADAVWTDWQRGAAHWSRPWALGVLGDFLRQA